MYIAIFYDRTNSIHHCPPSKTLKELHQRIGLYKDKYKPSGGLVQVIKTSSTAPQVLGHYVYTPERLCKAL